jgi:hypothetical protein
MIKSEAQLEPGGIPELPESATTDDVSGTAIPPFNLHRPPHLLSRKLNKLGMSPDVLILEQGDI